MKKVEINCETGETITIDMTEEEISLILPEVLPSYEKLRAAEYPDFRLYLDGVVKGDDAQIQEYIDACLAVKSKYPKI